MFGTIAHMRPLPGKEQELVAKLHEWDSVRRPKIKGAVGGCIFRSERDPRELLMMAVFTDRDSYYANANDPDQDRWYRSLRSLLEADPTWEDGEMLGGWGLLDTGKIKERGK